MRNRLLALPVLVFLSGLLPAALLKPVMAQTGSEPVPWLQQLPTLRTDARTTSFRARMRHVEPGQDGWLSERTFEEIDARMKGFSAALTARPVNLAKLNEIVHPDFRGTSLEPRRRVPKREKNPVVYSLEPDPEVRVAATEFLAELSHLAADDHVLTQAKFKLVSTFIDGAREDHAHTRVWYDLVARSSEGALQQQVGHWELDWQRDAASGWRMLGLVAGPSHLSRTPYPVFTDITDSAIKAGPALEQLRRGLETWTLRLDASFPISDEGYSGLAVADVNGDGWEDFYVAQPAALPNRLFLSAGDGTFEEGAAAAGVDLLDDTSAPLFFDYDNDGDPDLLLVGRGSPLLLSNQGDGTFVLEDSGQAGLTGAGQEFHNPMSICAADFDRDGWLDFYVTSYQLQYDDKGIATHPLPYHDAQNGPPNFFYRNNGDGSFGELTQQTGLNQNNNRFSYACAWGDYNNDGYPDLYVANDFGRNNLYRNNGDGTLSDVAAEAGVEDIAAGMSAAWEDYDNDGWLDLYVGNMWSSAGLRVTSQDSFKQNVPSTVQSMYRRHAKGNTLFRNRGDGTFEDVTAVAGVALGRWAWGSDFFDIDSDGHEDILVVNGFLTNESSQDL